MEQTTKRTPAKDEDCAALLRGEIADGLKEVIGLRPEIAEHFANGLTEFLRRRIGAQRIWIPAPSRAARDAAIYAEFNGTNAAEICQRHDIGRTRLYEILEEQRECARSGSPLLWLKSGQQEG